MQADRIELPAPMTGRRAVRTEQQHWQRQGRAAGALTVGYDAADAVVRVEYHWWRYLSRANPALADVYTAELWVRQPDGHWLYIIQPGGAAFQAVQHAALRPILARHLNLDVGD